LIRRRWFESARGSRRSLLNGRAPGRGPGNAGPIPADHPERERRRRRRGRVTSVAHVVRMFESAPRLVAVSAVVFSSVRPGPTRPWTGVRRTARRRSLGAAHRGGTGTETERESDSSSRQPRTFLVGWPCHDPAHVRDRHRGAGSRRSGSARPPKSGPPCLPGRVGSTRRTHRGGRDRTGCARQGDARGTRRADGDRIGDPSVSTRG
jgi:hypothetical protein